MILALRILAILSVIVFSYLTYDFIYFVKNVSEARETVTQQKDHKEQLVRQGKCKARWPQSEVHAEKCVERVRQDF